MANKQILSVVAASLLAASFTFTGCGNDNKRAPAAASSSSVVSVSSSSASSVAGTTLIKVSDAYVLLADVTAGGVAADLEVGEGVYEFLSSPLAGDLLVKNGVNDTNGNGVAETGEALAPEMSAPAGYANVNPFTTMLVNGVEGLSTTYPAAAAVMAANPFDFDVVAAGENLDVAKETAKAALTLSAEQHGGAASSASSESSESSTSSVCLPGQNCDGSASSESSEASESSESSESSEASVSSESSVSSGGSIVPDPFGAPGFRDGIVPDPFEEPETSSSSVSSAASSNDGIVPDPFASSSSVASTSSVSSESSESSVSSVSSASSSAGGYDLTAVFAAIDECTDVECINGHVQTAMAEINGVYTAPASSSEEASSSVSSVEASSASSASSVCLPGQSCGEEESSSSEETASSSSEAEEPTCPAGYIYSGDPATGCIEDPNASSVSSSSTASTSSESVVPDPFA